MDADTLRSLNREFNSFIGRFGDCFSDRRSRKHLGVYLRGQLSDLDRKSVEPIALAAKVRPRTLQEFLSLLSWDHDRLRDRVQRIVAAEHAGAGSVGIVDETTFVKKGTRTPGVHRQWCGHLGKIENCVTTVHLAYARGGFQCLLDGDLFLPEAWDQDRERCRGAGIPDTVVHRPKWRIALEQYDRAVANGLRFDWLTFDEGYGGKPEFLAELTARNQVWVAEVPKNTCGWLTEPRVTERPYRTHPRGRPRSKRRLVSGQPEARRLDEWLDRHPQLRDHPWEKYRLDDRQKGPSVWQVKHVRFHPRVDGGLPGAEWHLLVARHVLQDGEVKYFVSNAPAGTPTATLLYVALTRHRVERCFQDQKSELGLHHFEGRTYVGLLRHLYLTLVSYLFAVRAVVARRGEKPGVDGPPGATGGRGSGGRSVADRAGEPNGVGPVGAAATILSSPQPTGPEVERQANAAPAEGTGHTPHRNDTMQGARLAL
jgi:SRSO17 transposase